MSSTEVEDLPSVLDEEIDSLKEELTSLRKTIKIECSTILSFPSIQKSLRSKAESKPKSKSRFKSKPSHPNQKLVSLASLQEAHTQQCLYRISTSVTSFKVHDPDPNAVDEGHVLGLRFEIMSRGQFLKPYYVMLNRPYSSSKFLRVHRHTVPPAVPLAALAVRHLPAPKPNSEDPPQQDLELFVRTLRREIMRYHNRLGASADLRRTLGLHREDREVGADSIVDVGIADAEAKQIRLTWADERNGRIVMDDDGKIVNVVVLGSDGRDWDTTQEFEKCEHVDDVVKVLEDYAVG